jgi:hypothetical protein
MILNLCKLCEKPIKKPSGTYPDILCIWCSHAEQKRLKTNNKRAKDILPKEVIGFHDWISVLKLHNFSCAKCGITGRKNITLDHIKPLGKGGINKAINSQPLCEKCHNKKDHQKPKVFRTTRRKMRELIHNIKYFKYNYYILLPQTWLFLLLVLGYLSQKI